MALTTTMLDELVGDCKTPQEVENDVLPDVAAHHQPLVEAEMQAHLRPARHQPTGTGDPCSHNLEHEDQGMMVTFAVAD